MIQAAFNIASIGTLFSLEELPRKTAVRAHDSIMAPLKSRVPRGVFIYRLTTGVGTGSLMAFMPLFAEQKISPSATLIGVLPASRTPVAILQSYTGRLADKWDRRSMVFSGSIVSIVALTLLPPHRRFSETTPEL